MVKKNVLNSKEINSKKIHTHTEKDMKYDIKTKYGNLWQSGQITAVLLAFHAPTMLRCKQMKPQHINSKEDQRKQQPQQLTT